MATQLKWYEATTEGDRVLFKVAAVDDDDALERAMAKCIDVGIGYTPDLEVRPAEAPAVHRVRRPGGINFGS